MKKNSEQIKKIGEKILNEIQFGYDKTLDFQVMEIDLAKQSYHTFEKATWSFIFEFGKEDYGVNRKAFLYIDDETGTPLYLQHSTGIIKLSINKKGKVVTK